MTTALEFVPVLLGSMATIMGILASWAIYRRQRLETKKLEMDLAEREKKDVA
jgi:hypothetical protein